MISFGPVPSRRLGRSLGINNIPSKHCSYSCIYCQLGATHKSNIDRKTFYNPEDIFADVQEAIKNARKKGINIDYITFVASGEPTLDINLGNTIDLLKLLGYKIAVISNGSLLWIEDVRSELKKADLVSLKIDTIDPQLWQKINRPNKSLHFSSIKNGLLEYSSTKNFITETMILDQINSNEKHAHQLANFIAKLNPVKTFLTMPIRPPAIKSVSKPDKKTVMLVYKIFSMYLANVELLTDAGDNSYLPINNIKKEILNLCSVHPLKEEFLESFLIKGNADWKIIEDMIIDKLLKSIEYDGSVYYIRALEN